MGMVDKVYIFNIRNSKVCISFEKIIFCKAADKATEIFLQGGETICVMHSLKILEDKLPSSLFFRCHRSFLINLNSVKSFNSRTIFTRFNYFVPLSKSKYYSFIEKYKRFLAY